mgnify:FL=1
MQRILISLIVFFPIFIQADPRSEYLQTDLDAYVHKDDASFNYVIEKVQEFDGYFVHSIRMNSQNFLQSKDVNKTSWSHWLTVIEPKEVKAETALLVISSGDTNDPLPKAQDALIEIALASNSLVAELKAIPNQPLKFSDESFDRWEDAIIAYTWNKFFLTGETRWPARMAMTKSVIAAMDTIQVVFKRNNVNSFVVTGASKRGWTTWTAAATDNRVIAIIPLVIDMLNIKPSFEHHWQAYGFWAPAIQDYVDMNTMDWWGSPEAEALFKLVDPYSYKDRYQFPKYIINAAGDEFFIPTSSQFYYDQLPGEKHIRYVPNVGHSLNGSYIIEAIASFYISILNSSPRPEYSWNFLENGQIEFTSDNQPSEVKLWWADNPSSRDFRLDVIGKSWKSKSIKINAEGKYISSIDKPEEGWRAYFVEAIYGSNSLPFIITSEVKVSPDILPFEYIDPINPKGFISSN